jgi:ABC-type antimicrobial peptide transport system permease subunit
MAYGVTRRRGEFGTRIALGASRGNIVRLVLAQGLVTALIGVAIGIGGALMLTRTLHAL